MSTEAKVKVRVGTRMIGIGAAARKLGFNRSHLQKCAAGKRKAGSKTLEHFRALGLDTGMPGIQKSVRFRAANAAKMERDGTASGGVTVIHESGAEGGAQ